MPTGGAPRRSAQPGGAPSLSSNSSSHTAPTLSCRTTAVRPCWQIAEDWANRDVEAALRDWAAPGEEEEVCCERTERPDGTELVVVKVRSSLGSSYYEKETGHGRIVKLLRGLRPR